MADTAVSFIKNSLDVFPIQVNPFGVSAPVLGVAPMSFLVLVQRISLVFTMAISFQIGVDNLLHGGRMEARLANWKGFADKTQFQSGPLYLVWVVGLKVMMLMQLFAAAAGFLSIAWFIGVDAGDAPFGSWGFACGALALDAYVIALVGMRWSKDYPAAAATIPYIVLAAITAVVHLPMVQIDASKTKSYKGYIFLEMIFSVVVAGVFVQSGIDKVVDWSGNAAWLSGYFSDTLIAPFWFPGLATLTIVELLSGFVALAAVFLYQQGEAQIARGASILSVLLMLGGLSVIIIGMLFKRDHAQAGPVIPYVNFALGALVFLANGY